MTFTVTTSLTSWKLKYNIQYNTTNVCLIKKDLLNFCEDCYFYLKIVQELVLI